MGTFREHTADRWTRFWIPVLIILGVVFLGIILWPMLSGTGEPEERTISPERREALERMVQTLHDTVPERFAAALAEMRQVEARMREDLRERLERYRREREAEVPEAFAVPAEARPTTQATQSAGVLPLYDAILATGERVFALYNRHAAVEEALAAGTQIDPTTRPAATMPELPEVDRALIRRDVPEATTLLLKAHWLEFQQLEHSAWKVADRAGRLGRLTLPAPPPPPTTPSTTFPAG